MPPITVSGPYNPGLGNGLDVPYAPGIGTCSNASSPGAAGITEGLCGHAIDTGLLVSAADGPATTDSLNGTKVACVGSRAGVDAVAVAGGEKEKGRLSLYVGPSCGPGEK